MIEKLERLIDAATAYFEQQLKDRAPAVQAGQDVKPAEVKTRKRRTPEAQMEVKNEKVGPEITFLFEAINGAAATAAPAFSPEELGAARTACQESIGVFIRRFLKSTPTGLERAKALIAQHAPSEKGKQIPEFDYKSAVKLKAVFDKEVEAAAVGGAA